MFLIFGPPLYLIIAAFLLLPILVIYIFYKRYLISKKNGFNDNIIDHEPLFTKKEYIIGITILFFTAYCLTYFPIFS